MENLIDLSPYDFVDFGCSEGGSISFAEKRFAGGDALGIDIDPEKVALTTSKGRSAVIADATDGSRFKGNVRFSTMLHFLEHLPDHTTVADVVRTAVRISRDFVFIKQPWFDSDGELFARQLKFYWSDWSGHPMPLTSLQMYRSIRGYVESGRVARAAILGHVPVIDTSDECIVPVSCPINSGKYDEELHGPKELFQLATPSFRELVAVIAITDGTIVDDMLGRFSKATLLCDIVPGQKPLPCGNEPSSTPADRAGASD